MDERIYLHGDPGWDFETIDTGGRVRVDVVHLGAGREPSFAHLIINPEHPKLVSADVYLVVAGPPWMAVGAITRERFLEEAILKDFGFGLKLSVPCTSLGSVISHLPLFQD